MDYLIKANLKEKKPSLFRITAKDEEEAKEKLKLRFPPKEKENIIIESIQIDMTTVSPQTFGEFGGE